MPDIVWIIVLMLGFAAGGFFIGYGTGYSAAMSEDIDDYEEPTGV